MDFEMIRRIDPSINSDMFGGEHMRDSKEELRMEMSRDADFAKVKNKLIDRLDLTDPLNA